MKMSEIKELADKDLREKIEVTEKELHRMRLNHSVTPLENPSQIKATRHDIARMKTELRMRELNK